MSITVTSQHPFFPAICPPVNLAGVTQCGTNDIIITWDPSPWPDVTYFLFSQQDSTTNSTFNTTATSIILNHLQCGWLFTVRVAAQDNTCISQYSAPVQIRTGMQDNTGTFSSRKTALIKFCVLFVLSTMLTFRAGSHC